MKKTGKIILTAVTAAFIVMSAAAVLMIYRTKYRETEIARFVSPDRSRQLTVYEIGEPGFPFGPADCRVVLLAGKDRIGSLDMQVFNDGGWAKESDFSAAWTDDSVSVTVHSEEQEDRLYEMFSDGRIFGPGTEGYE